MTITAEQQEARKKFIGGSDAACVAGLSPWGGPMSVWLDKLGLTEPDDPTEEMELGNLLEPVVLELFTRRTGFKVTGSPTVVHPEYPFFGGHPDGVVWGIEERPIIVEAKALNLFARRFWGEPGTDDVPIQYLIQVLWYCMIMDAAYGYIAVLFGGQEFLTYKIERNKMLEDSLILECREFWLENIEKEVPPLAETGKEAKAFLNKFQVQKSGTIREATFEEEDLLDRQRVASMIADMASRSHEDIKDEIRLLIGSDAGIQDGLGNRATNKANKYGTRVLRFHYVGS